MVILDSVRATQIVTEKSGDLTVNGNIDANAQVMVSSGNLKVKGSISSGATATASGNVTVEGNIGSNVKVTTAGDLIVKSSISSGATAKATGNVTVESNIGSNVNVTAARNIIVKGSISSGATATASGNVTVEGNIGSNVKVTTAGDLIVKSSISSGATAKATGNVTVEGNIGSSAIVIAHNGNVIVNSNIGPGAIVTADNGNIIVNGNIEAGATVTLSNGAGYSLTAGSIATGAHISLNGGLLDIKSGRIPPSCSITSSSNFSAYTVQPSVNSLRTMNERKVISQSGISGSCSVNSGICTSEMTVNGQKVVVRHYSASGEVWINSYKFPFQLMKGIEIQQKGGGNISLNGYKIEVNDQGLLVDGRLVKDGQFVTDDVIESKASLEPTLVQSSKPSFELSSTSPAFLSAPPSDRPDLSIPESNGLQKPTLVKSNETPSRFSSTSSAFLSAPASDRPNFSNEKSPLMPPENENAERCCSPSCTIL